MLEILIGNIFVMFGGRVVQQIVGILMCTSYSPVPLFVWVRTHKGASQENEKKLTRSVNFTFRSIDDVFWLHNSNDFVDGTYPIELEIRIPHIQLGLYYTLTNVAIDSEDRLRTKLYDTKKRWLQLSYCELSI